MSGREFEDTLDQLEAERQQTEDAYFATLEQLRRRAQLLAERAAEAEAAAARVEAWPGRPEVAAVSIAATAPMPVVEPAAGWPSDSGFRGLVNRMIRWLARDYLEALDRRQERADETARLLALRDDEAGEAWRQLAAGIEPRHRALVDGIESVGDAAARTHALVEAVRETVNALRAGFDQIEPMSEHLRLLGDAKHAEVLRRATEGPTRRTELLFDELERRQEALLAQLEARCRELENRGGE
jgi:hypothetical protein